MTATSAASTLGDSWNRLPGFSPPSLAAAGLPKGKVLVVVDDAILALDLQRLLSDAGWRVVGPAATVTEVQRLLQPGDIACAILDLDIDRRAPLPIADLLAFADIPFVYLTTGVLGPVPARHRQRPVVEKPFGGEILIAAVEKAMARPREVFNDNRWPAGGSVAPWTRVYPPI